ncbi:glycosyltransferase family 2 protein [Candidatus Latescibacterota bacterium]
MNSTYSISVVLPVYNEAEILEPSLLKINSFMSEHFEEFELLVVESGSTDGSGDICDRLSETIPSLKVIHEGQRNGIGSGTRLGYSTASKDIVLLYTVDFPFPLKSIIESLPHFSDHDCVLSYRSEDQRNSLFRKLQSFVYNNLVKTVLGLKVKHVNSAFKAFKRDVIQDFQLTANSGFIDTETVFWVHRKKISFTEIPVVFTEREGGESTITPFSFIFFLKELFILRKRFLFK